VLQWLELVGHAIAKDLPESAQPPDAEGRKRWPWWKASVCGENDRVLIPLFFHVFFCFPSDLVLGLGMYTSMYMCVCV
jgi:hypothetical protein